MEKTLNRVIDISYYQGNNIDFNSVVNEGITGVIVKAMDGRSEEDYFKDQLHGAINAGLPVGAYAFTYGTTTEYMQEQANLFADMLDAEGGSNAFPLGVWLDIEDDSKILSKPHEDITQLVSAFISEMNSRGYNCGIYLNQDWLVNNINVYSLGDYVPLWIAAPNEDDVPKVVNNYSNKFWFWQYTFKGIISGIDADVDISYDLR
jgi:GH25 family lysozyme M1 (1,4-beta-N-acetylmuramidase)